MTGSSTRSGGALPRRSDSPASVTRAVRSTRSVTNDVDAPSSDGEPPRQSRLVSYSDVDQLRRKDFAACTPEELEEISRLLRETHVQGDPPLPEDAPFRRDHGRHDTTGDHAAHVAVGRRGRPPHAPGARRCARAGSCSCAM